jgi:Glycosyltransferase family 87
VPELRHQREYIEIVFFTTRQRTLPVRRIVTRELLDRTGLMVMLTFGVVIGLGWAFSSALPVDADMYWRASSSGAIYGTIWGADQASRYIYPPPLAQLLQPLHALGWPVFVALWTVGIFVALWGSTRWWSLAVLAVSGSALLAFGFDHALANPLMFAFIGNVQSIVALAILLSFRWPAAWAIVLLTKIGPGIGILWFAVRGEWRQLSIALGATVAIGAVSYVLSPSAWLDFFRFATANATTAAPVPVVPVPLLVRLVMSGLLIVWGARSDRRWTVPVAAGWASLALYEWSAITVWVAALPLLGDRAPTREAKTQVGGFHERDRLEATTDGSTNPAPSQ